MNKEIEETDTGNKETGKNPREDLTRIVIPAMTRKWITIATGLRTEAEAWLVMMRTWTAQGRDLNLKMTGGQATGDVKCQVMVSADMGLLKGVIMEEKAVNTPVVTRDIGGRVAESCLISMTNADTVPVSAIKMMTGHHTGIRIVTGMKMTGDSVATAEIWDQTGAADKIWTIMTATGDPATSVPGKGSEEDRHGMKTATRDTAAD